MPSKPILFSGEMVRAILEGRKAQTRRVVKPQPDSICDGKPCEFDHNFYNEDEIECPYGQPGDRLWVRESMHRDESGPWHYSADCETVTVAAKHESAMRIWAHHKEQDYCPSIHMPRWASRITLDITQIRVERVQDISQEDARAEGGPPSHWSIDAISQEYGYKDFPRSWFAQTWDSINAKRGFGWDKNPFVWCVTFRRVNAE